MKARLSMAFQDLRGKDGNIVIKNSRNGLILTPLVTPKNPKTPAQRAIRGYFTRATQTYEGMTPTQANLWKNYALTINETDPITGKNFHPTAINAFVGLTVKFLQLTPGGTIPMTPPAAPFSGDTIVVSASQGDAGMIEFTANAANATGITTELLLQKLPNANATPDPNGYVHAGWKAYTSGSLVFELAVVPGVYSAAYRFVKNSTGQATPLTTLPITTITFAVVEGGQSTNKKLKKAA